MSALPITPLTRRAPGSASVRARTRSRLVVAARRVAADDATPNPAADDPVVAPAAQARVPLGLPRGPRTPVQALRRRVVALLAAGVFAGGLVVGALEFVASSADDVGTAGLSMVPASAETVVVRPGETVWSIASARRPAGVSTADYAAMIVDQNGLAGGAVDQWQVLVLPTP